MRVLADTTEFTTFGLLRNTPLKLSHPRKVKVHLSLYWRGQLPGKLMSPILGIFSLLKYIPNMYAFQI